MKKPFLLHSNCTNRYIASQLSTRSIDLDSASIPYGALSAKNLFAPTLPLYPLLDKTLYWSELTNLSLNYQSLLNLDSLKKYYNSMIYRLFITHRLQGNHKNA